MDSNTTVKCPAPMTATSNGAFQGDDPLHFALPLAILQIVLVVVLTRVIACLLKPLRQPRVIAEIIGGILLGPSALGRNHKFIHIAFPPQSLRVLDTLANLGLLFFLFLVGLELDPQALRRTGKKALSIALAGISLQFALGIGTSFVLRGTVSKGVSEGPILVSISCSRKEGFWKWPSRRACEFECRRDGRVLGGFLERKNMKACHGGLREKIA